MNDELGTPHAEDRCLQCQPLLVQKAAQHNTLSDQARLELNPFALQVSERRIEALQPQIEEARSRFELAKTRIGNYEYCSSGCFSSWALGPSSFWASEGFFLFSAHC